MKVLHLHELSGGAASLLVAKERIRDEPKTLLNALGTTRSTFFVHQRNYFTTSDGL